MITKINKIKNLGLFSNYRWDGQLPQFKTFNVIYGWNGSGKTTLSRLFAALETGKHEKFNDLQYDVEIDGIAYSQGNPCNTKIRVFNEDYVENNIDMISGKANSIFILGKEDKALAEEIKDLEVQLYGDSDNPEDFGLLKKLELIQKSLESKEKERGLIFSSVAKTIGQIGSGKTIRSYTKRNSEEDFYKLSGKVFLSSDEFAAQNATVNSEQKGVIAEITIVDIERSIPILLKEAQKLLECTVEVKVITELKDNDDLSQWVEHGMTLHKSQNSTSCLFCGQEIPNSRIEELLQFFTKKDQDLKIELDKLIQKLEGVKNKISKLEVPDEARFYSGFSEKYSIALSRLNISRNELVANISELIQEINNKKSHTNEALKLETNIDIPPFTESIRVLNEIVQLHNEKSKNFAKHVIDASEKIKVHYLSEVYDEINQFDREIEGLKKEIDRLKNGNPEENSEELGIIRIQQRIEENRNKISLAGLACDEFNSQLGTFLGRNELCFETTDEGYVLKRNGELAKNLSEGEKTAIAFVYFITHLKDIGFNADNGIIVIDDPISSLDSNSLFQAFSFLKNAVQDASQVFILTHNYDFLRLINNWFNNLERKFKNTSRYMVTNESEKGSRIAKLVKLDDLLINYNTEYQFLFKLLKTYDPAMSQIQDVYFLPNIARKVLENFLMIMIPDSRDIYSKLTELPFDELKKNSIYSFVNDQSHMTGKGFDPSLVPEAKKVIPYLLEMIETTFPDHYKILTENCK